MCRHTHRCQAIFFLDYLCTIEEGDRVTEKNVLSNFFLTVTSLNVHLFTFVNIYIYIYYVYLHMYILLV